MSSLPKVLPRGYWPYMANLWRYSRVYRRHREYTMMSIRTYVDNLYLMDQWLKTHSLSEGCIVECGTWKGGMSFGLLDVCRQIEEFHCFDSFEGLPPAGELDGERARTLQQEGELVAENNYASIEEFTTGLHRFPASLHQKVTTHKGWFNDTVPEFKPERPIAILRHDGDWYDSTIVVLRNLFDQVMPNGLIVLDDYLAWEGCSKAVHDFLSERKAAERIRSTWLGRVCYIHKLPE